MGPWPQFPLALGQRGEHRRGPGPVQEPLELLLTLIGSNAQLLGAEQESMSGHPSPCSPQGPPRPQSRAHETWTWKGLQTLRDRTPSQSSLGLPREFLYPLLLLLLKETTGTVPPIQVMPSYFPEDPLLRKTPRGTQRDSAGRCLHSRSAFLEQWRPSLCLQCGRKQLPRTF